MSLATIKVEGQSITLDIREELERFDWGYGARWTENKLIASSPFREDRSPSFYINFTGKYAGRWGDSGSTDPNTSYGELPELLAQMTGTSVMETIEYLLHTYGTDRDFTSDDQIKIPKISLKEVRKPSIELSRLLINEVEYLTGRGISMDVQEKYRTGYMSNTPEFVSLNWTDEVTGEIVCIKNRAAKGRDMYYEKGSLGVNGLVYGLYDVKDSDYVVICEGEVDVLSFAEAGIPAVALGTANISSKQAEKIKYCGFERIYMGGDNDEAGLNLNRQMFRTFKTNSRLHLLDYGRYNDANDALLGEGKEILQEIVRNSKEITPKLLTNK